MVSNPTAYSNYGNKTKLFNGEREGKEDPWSRLNSNTTFSKTLKERQAHMQPDNFPYNSAYTKKTRHTYNDTQKDSLDLQLASVYNHHGQFLKGKTETCLQQDTLSLSDHCPVRRMKKKSATDISTIPPDLSLPPSTTLATNHPLRIIYSASKKVIFSSKNALSGHHTQTTNNGFTRKPDGGFYTS